MDHSLLEVLKALPIFQTARSAAAAAASDNQARPEFVSLLDGKLLAPPGTLDGLLAQLPPMFVSVVTDQHRNVLSGLGVPQLQAVEFYRQ